MRKTFAPTEVERALAYCEMLVYAGIQPKVEVEVTPPYHADTYYPKFHVSFEDPQ